VGLAPAAVTVQQNSTFRKKPVPANCKDSCLWVLGLWELELVARHPSPGDRLSPPGVNVDAGRQAGVQVQAPGTRFRLRSDG